MYAQWAASRQHTGRQVQAAERRPRAEMQRRPRAVSEGEPKRAHRERGEGAAGQDPSENEAPPEELLVHRSQPEDRELRLRETERAAGKLRSPPGDMLTAQYRRRSEHPGGEAGRDSRRNRHARVGVRR